MAKLRASKKHRYTKAELENSRVIQRCVAYLLNLPSSISSPEVKPTQTLRHFNYLGQYGNIQELTIQPGFRGLFNAYVTFDSEMSVAKCITGCAGYMLHNATIKATFGMKKFCNFFVNKKECPKSECGYLHEIGSEDDIVPQNKLHIGHLFLPKDSVFEKFTFHRERLREYNTFPPVRVQNRNSHQTTKRKTYRPVIKQVSITPEDSSAKNLSRTQVSDLRTRVGIYNLFSIAGQDEDCNIESVVDNQY